MCRSMNRIDSKMYRNDKTSLNSRHLSDTSHQINKRHPIKISHTTSFLYTNFNHLFSSRFYTHIPIPCRSEYSWFYQIPQNFQPENLRGGTNRQLKTKITFPKKNQRFKLLLDSKTFFTIDSAINPTIQNKSPPRIYNNGLNYDIFFLCVCV